MTSINRICRLGEEETVADFCLIGATTFPALAPEKSIEGLDTSKPFYVTPIVDARKGLLRTSAGRMSQSQATEHDSYNDDPYENYGKLGY
jgi:hypothetical protein